MGKGTKAVAALFSMTATWGSYEFYHLMRAEDFMSITAIFYSVLSVGSAVLSGVVLRKVVAAR